MGSLHECGWLLLMLISNAYLYKFPRRAVSRSTRLGIEKGSAASKAAQKGKASEYMTTNRRPGKTYFAF